MLLLPPSVIGSLPPLRRPLYLCRRETKEREENIESARWTMGRGKRGSEAPAFFRLVKFYSIKVFENLRILPSGNEIGSYDKNVHPGDHFRKSLLGE